MPLGVLDFQRVQRGEQRLGFGLATGQPRPVPDVLVGRRLPPVLQLGDLRRRPRQRLRELPAGDPAAVRSSRSRLPSALRAS